VPLTVASIYGGPAAGCLTFIMLLATRTYLGGDALLFGYASIVLAFAAPLTASFKWNGLSGKPRVYATLLISVIPSVVMLVILIKFIQHRKFPIPADFHPIPAILSFAILQVLATWLSANLLEQHYERSVMRDQIQRAEKLKTLGELAASIAHEIRNPLTVVRGFLQLIRPNEQGKNREYLDIAMDELGRTETIINDYLNISKPKLTMLESFSATELLRGIVVLLTPMASNSGIRIESLLDEVVNMHTDRGQLQQALLNVLKNAIEATPVNGEVTVGLARIGNAAKIVIKDNGRGMTKEQLSRIGTLFFSTKEVGTGLGTALAMRIIESMNGTILYESQTGIGTTVTITLPAAS
jgi:two-component system sporulation sensor kinase B